MPDLSHHFGKLSNHIESNHASTLLQSNLRSILHLYEDGSFKISKYNVKTFKKIMFRLSKFKGSWDKESMEFKILYYALKGLLETEDAL